MITVDEALNRILKQLHTLDTEEKQLLDSIGQVIAEDIYAPFDIPNYDNSIMDGYAVKSSDIKGASRDNPALLEITGKISAGMAPDVKVGNKESIMIMTGSMIPEGADTVVPFEDTGAIDKQDEVSQQKVSIYQEYIAGTYIRKSGSDVKANELVIRKGQLIRSAEVGFLASIGRNKIKVIRRPIVAVLATGDELINSGESLSRGKIYNSNSYALAAQIIEFGGIPMLLGISSDNLDSISKIFRKETRHDLLITSGGVSEGKLDFVRDALKAEGEIEFWQVKMKPGKPLTFGMLGGTNKMPHLGLPGNPVSCMVTLEVFGRPSIFKMMGREDYTRPIVSAIIEDEISNAEGRRLYARVIVTKKDNDYHARLTGSQDSAVMSSMLKANGLAVVPEGSIFVKKGEYVKVMLLN